MMGSDGGDVAIGKGTGFVADVSLLFENAESRADRRIGRGIGKSLEDIAHGGGFTAIENVDYLALAFAERRGSGGFSGHAKFSAPAGNLALVEGRVKGASSGKRGRKVVEFEVGFVFGGWESNALAKPRSPQRKT